MGMSDKRRERKLKNKFTFNSLFFLIYQDGELIYNI